MVSDRLHNGVEVAGISESTVLDGLEDSLELGVELEAGTVLVSMAEIFDVLC